MEEEVFAEGAVADFMVEVVERCEVECRTEEGFREVDFAQLLQHLPARISRVRKEAVEESAVPQALAVVVDRTYLQALEAG